MESDLERLLNKEVSTLRISEPAIRRKPALAKTADRYLTLMCLSKTNDERQEFHDLMDLELNRPIHRERDGCIDDYRRFLPATADEQFNELIKLSLGLQTR